MVTKWDKIAFVLIAALLVLAIVFWSDISGAFGGKSGNGEDDGKKDKKEKKKDGDKDKDTKSSSVAPWLQAPLPSSLKA